MSFRSKLDKLLQVPADIYSLFNPHEHHTVNEDNLNEFSENLKQILRDRLSKQDGDRGPLRFSALGKPNRQMWFEAHPDGSKEEFDGKTLYKFLYGAVIEELVLFLAKEAGHEVTDTQRGVAIDGVKGSIDAIIDGVLVDAKSASPYGYQKFKNDTVYQDDPFGYVDQLAGYADVLTPGEDAAWLAVDKVSGDICISVLPSSLIARHKPAPRIAELKEIIASETPPPFCYEPIPDGKSGNLKLPTPCSYCAHKFRCHSGLRGFAYSGGPRYLTKVVKTPDVPEFTNG